MVSNLFFLSFSPTNIVSYFSPLSLSFLSLSLFLSHWLTLPTSGLQSSYLLSLLHFLGPCLLLLSDCLIHFLTCPLLTSAPVLTILRPAAHVSQQGWPHSLPPTLRKAPLRGKCCVRTRTVLESHTKHPFFGCEFIAPAQLRTRSHTYNGSSPVVGTEKDDYQRRPSLRFAHSRFDFFFTFFSVALLGHSSSHLPPNSLFFF